MGRALASTGLSAAQASLRLTDGRANNRFSRAGTLSLEEAEFLAELTGFRAAWLIWGEQPEMAQPGTAEVEEGATRAGYLSALAELREALDGMERKLLKARPSAGFARPGESATSPGEAILAEEAAVRKIVREAREKRGKAAGDQAQPTAGEPLSPARRRSGSRGATDPA